MKKILMVLVLAALVAGGAFAQVSLSAGVGGNFGFYQEIYSHPDVDADYFKEGNKPYIGGGGFAYFDATYVMAKVGLFVAGKTQEEEYYAGFDSSFNPIYKKYEVTYSTTFLSLGLLGKYPIDLGGFTLFPMIGFEYDVFMSMKMKADGESETYKRGDADEPADMDLFIIQLGVGADFNLTEKLYLRPTVLWGINVKSTDYEKDFKDEDGKIFKHKLDVGIALGFKF